MWLLNAGACFMLRQLYAHSYNMSRIMRKPAFCICENKDADQLPSTSQIRNFMPLDIFSGCTARFVSDLVGNPEDRFSHNEAPIGTETMGS